MRNERQQAIAQRINVMIHDVEEEALQIRDIAGLMKSQDLAVAFSHQFGPQNEAVSY
jgi:hypothetical protein